MVMSSQNFISQTPTSTHQYVWSTKYSEDGREDYLMGVLLRVGDTVSFHLFNGADVQTSISSAHDCLPICLLTSTPPSSASFRWPKRLNDGTLWSFLSRIPSRQLVLSGTSDFSEFLISLSTPKNSLLCTALVRDTFQHRRRDAATTPFLNEHVLGGGCKTLAEDTRDWALKT